MKDEKKGRKIVFAVFLFLICLLPAVFTNSIYGYFPLCVYVLTMLFSLAYLKLTAVRIRLSCGTEDAKAVRGEKVEAKMRVTNDSILTCGSIEAELFLSDSYGQTDLRAKAFLTVNGKSSADFGFTVDTQHVGMYTAGVRNVKIYDMLGFFSKDIAGEYKMNVIVLPREREEDASFESIMESDSPKAIHTRENDGYDLSGVREYAYGDPMKKIHWNMSAHMREYMTKINEVSLLSDLSIIIDSSSKGKEGEELLYINDGIMETAAYLCREAEKEDLRYRIVFESKSKDIRFMDQEGSADLEDLILSSCLIGQNVFSGAALLREERSSNERSYNVAVITSEIDDDLLNEMIFASDEGQNLSLYYVVLPGLDHRKRNEELKRLSVLDEREIYYEVVKA